MMQFPDERPDRLPIGAQRPAKPKKPPTKATSKPGPAPELFKIEGMSRQDAIKKSLTKKKPPGGWPKMGRGM